MCATARRDNARRQGASADTDELHVPTTISNSPRPEAASAKRPSHEAEQLSESCCSGAGDVRYSNGPTSTNLNNSSEYHGAEARITLPS